MAMRMSSRPSPFRSPAPITADPARESRPRRARSARPRGTRREPVGLTEHQDGAAAAEDAVAVESAASREDVIQSVAVHVRNDGDGGAHEGRSLSNRLAVGVVASPWPGLSHRWTPESVPTTTSSRIWSLSVRPPGGPPSRRRHHRRRRWCSPGCPRPGSGPATERLARAGEVVKGAGLRPSAHTRVRHRRSRRRLQSLRCR